MYTVFTVISSNARNVRDKLHRVEINTTEVRGTHRTTERERDNVHRLITFRHYTYMYLTASHTALTATYVRHRRGATLKQHQQCMSNSIKTRMFKINITNFLGFAISNPA